MPSSKLGRAPSGRFLSGNPQAFQAGNTAAVKSGIHSLTVVRERSVEVRQELTDLMAKHLAHLSPSDQPMVDLAVDVATKLRLINEYLDHTSGGSLIDRRGVVRNSARVYLELTRHLMTVFRELGIGPRARAEIVGSLGLANQQRASAVQQAQDRLRAKVVGAPAEGDGTDA